ncbi:MAG: N-terminal phage integrase SAM-like domain-containing protein [Actinomycetota bacterium]|nr:N-terminal phage integrase SAM-like domain-containing protein [Actinomycetota bacterium]
MRTGVTFAAAAAEWLRFIEEGRERKPSTLIDYRNALWSRLLPAFGERPIEEITAEDIEHWRRSLSGLSNRSKNKLLIQLHGIFRRAQMVWAIPVNPLARVEKHPMRPSGDIGVLARGGLGTCPRCRLRPRWRDLSDRAAFTACA